MCLDICCLCGGGDEAKVVSCLGKEIFTKVMRDKFCYWEEKKRARPVHTFERLQTCGDPRTGGVLLFSKIYY